MVASGVEKGKLETKAFQVRKIGSFRTIFDKLPSKEIVNPRNLKRAISKVCEDEYFVPWRILLKGKRSGDYSDLNFWINPDKKDGEKLLKEFGWNKEIVIEAINDGENEVRALEITQIEIEFISYEEFKNNEKPQFKGMSDISTYIFLDFLEYTKSKLGSKEMIYFFEEGILDLIQIRNDFEKISKLDDRVFSGFSH